jgi:two-component system, OmpR family, phosphate regulon response regulator PhoB
MLDKSGLRICVVEDDRSQRALLKVWLDAQGYEVEAIESGRELLKLLETKVFHLLILDWNLPDIQGDQLLQRVKRAKPTLPVIFQTVHDHEDDIVRMLDAGADDYLVKPLGKATLLARTRAVLRRVQTPLEMTNNLNVGGIRLNRVAQTLRTAATTIECGEKEFAIAWYLAQRVGQVVLRQQLLADIWERNADVETRTVDMYVSRLRSKLRQANADEWHVQSIYGTGYRLEIIELEPEI